MSLIKRYWQDWGSAQEKYQAFEFAYQLLRPEDLKYLRERSLAYKKSVLALQALFLPAVSRVCPTCPFGTCCRLHSPRLKIYIAGSLGCFRLEDYLLVRCGTELPAADLSNAEKNLCAFWDNGCRLPPRLPEHHVFEVYMQAIKRRVGYESGG